MSLENHDPLILVVEDEPKLAQLMIDYLHASNYRTITSPTATACWIMYARPHPT